MTMKKYIKLYALVAMALFVGSCEDELQQAFEPIKIVPGEEIIFSATTEKKDTRTIYGDAFDSDKDNKNDKIELQWMDEDRVNIASFQATGVPNHVAEYEIGIGEDEVGPNNNGNDSISHEAKSLTRVGDSGLQWTDSEYYDFYAVYPSNTQVEPYLPAEGAADRRKDYGLSVNDAGASLVGYLPVDQTSPYSTNTSVRRPNMDYAYMTARKTKWERPEDNIIDAENEMINLEFSSLVTALKLTLKPGQIGFNNTASGDQIQISALTLFSESKENLCGNFKYDFNTTNGNDAVESLDAKGTHSQVMMSFGEHVTFTTNGGESLTVTFFLLPKKYTPGDLKLRVHYYVGTTPQFMEATLGLDIPVCEMTYINNLKLKDLGGQVQGSRWFTALDENVYINQLSMPVAANVFANKSYSPNLENGKYRWQQTFNLRDLWNLGVRGFELCTQSNTPENKSSADCFTYNLDGMPMIAAEQDVTGQLFANQLDSLYNLMFETKDGKTEKTGEPLVLICTYASRSDGYNPMHWTVQLFNSLQSFCTRNSIASPGDIFVQLNANTTVQDLCGKIAVIIRPGSDERWVYNTSVYNQTTKRGTTCDPTYLLNGTTNVKENSPYGYTLGIPSATHFKEKSRTISWSGIEYPDTDPIALPTVITSNDWWNRVLLISDWGIDSWDSWHRRFATSTVSNLYKYATTATNFNNIPNDRRKIENQSFYEQYIVNGNAPATGNYYYNYDMYMGRNGNAHKYGTAYVQDMTRVIDKDYLNLSVDVYNESSSPSKKTVHWKASLTEKKKAIEGLFKLAVATKNVSSTNSIYINSLSGYYPDADYSYTTKVSQYSSSLNGGDVSFFPVYDSEGFKNSGKGGDYLACANALTPYVYGILSGSSKLSDDKTYIAEGPWGLVMMDYIGTATSSQNLTNLIMLNNFSFSLKQKEDVNPAAEKRVELSDEKISPELNILVNWDYQASALIMCYKTTPLHAVIGRQGA